MTDLVSKQTRATIAYALVFAFVLDALASSFSWYSGGNSAAIKDLTLIAVSFYFGSKSNGNTDRTLATKIVSAVKERE